ncbi:MAG: hypothetical protein SGJ27_28055 [Candidatus Melainabacteria bacterium]|nr:hypothetical protein [Candidatus Melainabacteria bacterium]
MNNSTQQSNFLPELMIDMFATPEKAATRTDSLEFDTDMLLAQELLSDLMPGCISQRQN